MGAYVQPCHRVQIGLRQWYTTRGRLCESGRAGYIEALPSTQSEARTAIPVD